MTRLIERNAFCGPERDKENQRDDSNKLVHAKAQTLFLPRVLIIECLSIHGRHLRSGSDVTSHHMVLEIGELDRGDSTEHVL